MDTQELKLLTAIERAFQNQAEVMAEMAADTTNKAVQESWFTASLAVKNCATAINNLRVEKIFHTEPVWGRFTTESLIYSHAPKT